MQAPLGGANPRPDDVRITSLTGAEISGLVATIAYGPGQPTGWLSTAFDQPSTPARLWLTVTTGSVPEGDWWADVTVSAPGGGTPRVIRVHFTVKPPVADALVTLELGGFTIFDLSPGTGIVTGNGFDCDFTSGSHCSQRLPIGTELTLTATPDPNNFFLCWATPTPDCPGSMDPQYNVTLSGDLTIWVYFALYGYDISVTVVGAGADGVVEAPDGSDLPGGINCQLAAGVQSGQCGAHQWYGARSTSLSARAAEGSVFVGWTSGCTAVGGTTCELAPLPGGSYSVTATFARP